MTALVIFDLDGVLVDSEVIASEVIARAMQAYAVAITGSDVIAQHTGRRAEDIVSLTAAAHGISFPNGFAHELEALVLAELVVALKPVAGLTDILARLDRMSWCVASNSPVARMERCLAAAGLTPRFAPRLFSAEHVAKGKPAPDVYLHAAQEMGAAPYDCVVIEDTVIGVTAGKAAGMTVIGFLGGSHCRADHTAALQAAGADLIAADSATLGKFITLFRDRREMAARLSFS
jgi:HAD superfamily hydrolase (TIGR01509 family)